MPEPLFAIRCPSESVGSIHVYIQLDKGSNCGVTCIREEIHLLTPQLQLLVRWLVSRSTFIPTRNRADVDLRLPYCPSVVLVAN